MKKEIAEFIKKYSLKNLEDLSATIEMYKDQLNPELIYIAADLLNPNKDSTAAYYTDSIICKEIFKELPNFDDKEHIQILEPSVGAGAFLPFIAEHFKSKQIVEIWINDIDQYELKLAKLIFDTYYKKKYPNYYKLFFHFFLHLHILLIITYFSLFYNYIKLYHHITI